MADQERKRYFKNPESFLLAVVDGLRKREDWDLIVERAGILTEARLAALVARTMSSPATVIWIDPKQSRPDRTFALGWSVGVVVLTENLSTPPV